MEKLLECYNAKEFERISELLHPQLTFVHHGFMSFGSAEEHVNLIQGVARIFSDRRWTHRTLIATDDAVVVQGTWSGTAQEDVPGRAKAGQMLKMEFCSIFSFDDHGRISRWEDYGAPEQVQS